MGTGELWYVCFNPEIISGTGIDNFEEGCLSFPGLFLPITRPASIKVRYQMMDGKFIEETFTGLTARTYQHELDHLNGIVFTSKVSPIKLDKAKRKVKVNIKRLAAQAAAHDKAEKKITKFQTAESVQLSDDQIIEPKKPEQIQSVIETPSFTFESKGNS